MGDVFVLGAGFSCSISREMPTTNGLAESVAAALASDHRFAFWLDSGGQLPDVDLERWMSRLSERHPFDDEVTYQYNRATFSFVSRAIAQAIRRAQGRVFFGPGPFEWLRRLVQAWHENRATVITFNYDNLVEATWNIMIESGPGALASVLLPPGGISPWRSIWGSPGSATTFALCKLHGSVNWYWQPDGLSHQLFDLGVEEWWSQFDGSPLDEAAMAIRAGTRVPFIVPPTSLKGAFLQHAQHHWSHAHRALVEADRIWVIGYSLPLTDMVAASLIANGNSASAITVVNRDPAPVVERLIGLGFDPSRLDSVGGDEAVSQFAASYADDVLAGVTSRTIKIE